MPPKNKTTHLRIGTIVFHIALVLFALTVATVSRTDAATITSRKVTLSNSAGAATGVSYTLSTAALPTTATAVQSLKIEFCTTASGACSAPSGFSASSSTLASQPSGLGCASGWTVNTADANELRITATCASTPSGSVSVQWNSVANPTADNTTFYGRITTYSDTAWTTAIDGPSTAALSTAAQVTVSASIDETLTFCVYTGANCGAGGTSVNLGTLSTSSTGTGTSKFDAATNGVGGYAVTYSGTTLTSGGNTITAMGTQSPNGAATTSSTNTEQFGMNLRDNATPNIGTDLSGSGTGTYGTNYGTVDNFRHFTGDTIATASGATNSNTFTISYIANIGGASESGTYTTVMTFVCTATF